MDSENQVKDIAAKEALKDPEAPELDRAKVEALVDRLLRNSDYANDADVMIVQNIENYLANPVENRDYEATYRARFNGFTIAEVRLFCDIYSQRHEDLKLSRDYPEISRRANAVLDTV